MPKEATSEGHGEAEILEEKTHMMQLLQQDLTWHIFPMVLYLFSSRDSSFNLGQREKEWSKKEEPLQRKDNAHGGEEDRCQEKDNIDEPTWRCQQNPFIGALGIQEPVILGEPQI